MGRPHVLSQKQLAKLHTASLVPTQAVVLRRLDGASCAVTLELELSAHGVAHLSRAITI